MKCPACLHTMQCISEIHKLPTQPWRERMDLHCIRPYGKRRGCSASCHMGVLTEDSKEWVCHQYRFSFEYKDKHHILFGHDHEVDTFHQSVNRGTKTGLLTITGEDMVILPFFIPISAGDDMHEDAWKLFHRLYNLVTYS